MNSNNIHKEYRAISDFDIYLFHKGTHYQAYEFMGSHVCYQENRKGVRFTTWAPNAKSIIVVGNFSNWKIKRENMMKRINKEGLWSVFIQDISAGEIYKYAIVSDNGKIVLKSDPYARFSEKRPKTASIVKSKSRYSWKDNKWLENRKNTNIYKSPVNIYEVHLGSWIRKENGDFYTYKDLAKVLPKYVSDMGYTHVEIMPIMEHPLDDSWGYQVTGYYSVTSRFGDVDEFKSLIDEFHNWGIGVILDWVPGHFCKDKHGLYMFDGTPTYEYRESLKAENKGWGAANFDLGRNEVKSFLISNAVYWIKEFHVDGLRVDAVANMLYLDYDRGDGEWIPNKYGGKENIEAIEFFRELNTTLFERFTNILMIAEESTSWPMVSRPANIGGLGFNAKWNMGWMNDILSYIEIDPIYRRYHHNQITFSMMYHYSENFILPISHDEVVHGKKSLIDKMWGDYWSKFAGLRLFICYMITHPGKKTIFMGNEIAQFIEWRSTESIEWKLVEQFDMHKNTNKFFKDINYFYKENISLWKYDYEYRGFEWIDADNAEQSIIIFMRKGEEAEDNLIVVCNFTPSVYDNFKIGVPLLGVYEEAFNSDKKEYGGSGKCLESPVEAKKQPWHNQRYSIEIKVPPMACLILKITNIINENVDDKGSKSEEIIESIERKLLDSKFFKTEGDKL